MPEWSTAAGSFPHWYNTLPTLMKLLPDHIQQSVHGEAWLLAAGSSGGAGPRAVKEGHYRPLIPHLLLNVRDKAAGKSKNFLLNFWNLVVEEIKKKQKVVCCKNRENAWAQNKLVSNPHLRKSQIAQITWCVYSECGFTGFLLYKGFSHLQRRQVSLSLFECETWSQEYQFRTIKYISRWSLVVVVFF